MSIYADLIEFKLGILDRVRRDVSKLPPPARQAAETDVVIIESQMHGYEKRLELWKRRLADLNGLSLDPEMPILRYKGEQATLTMREQQLLRIFLEHPYRYFTVPQILDQAWGQSNLFPEQARSYVARLRRIFAALRVPCEIVNRPGRGYALVFRSEKEP